MSPALTAFIAALAHERQTMLGELDDLLSLALTASQASDPEARLGLARKLVDQTYDLLGTTEPAEELARELGWSDDDDDERSL